MKYWEIIYRTGGEDWETKSMIVDDNQYRLIQQALVNGEDMIVILGKPTIKRTSITSINEATHIVSDYQKQGLKIDGLLEPADKPKEIGDKGGRMRTAAEIIKDKKESLYKKMGWGI